MEQTLKTNKCTTNKSKSAMSTPCVIRIDLKIIMEHQLHIFSSESPEKLCVHAINLSATVLKPWSWRIFKWISVEKFSSVWKGTTWSHPTFLCAISIQELLKLFIIAENSIIHSFHNVHTTFYGSQLAEK